MNVILDTHAVIWFITGNSNLPAFSRIKIEDTKNNCFISIATFWEIGIKHSLGKLNLNAKLERIFELFLESGLTILSITPEHILECSTLPFHHRDTFDRLIIAQAKKEDYSIISKDREFKNYDVTLVWND